MKKGLNEAQFLSLLKKVLPKATKDRTWPARFTTKIEEEFWATKKGQHLQRDHVEKTFAKFVTHVPASALTESGLKRHYKEPESLKTLRLLATAELESF
jgi:hypothetical protein